MSITERIYVRGHVGVRSDLGNFLLPRDPSPSGAVYIRFLCLRAPTGKGRSSRLRKAFLNEKQIDRTPKEDRISQTTPPSRKQLEKKSELLRDV